MNDSDRFEETKAEYGTLPYRPVRKFTREEAEAWLEEVTELRKKIVAKYGPCDVTELIRDTRGELED